MHVRCGRMCRAGGMSLSVGTQLVVEVVQRHLPPTDWLPILRDQLDVIAMMGEATSRLQVRRFRRGAFVRTLAGTS